jgi:hypothetical protein
VDPFSHALWSVIVFNKLRKQLFWVMLFGVFPDLISNVPFLVWKSVYFYVLGLPVTDIVFRDWLVLVPPQVYAIFTTIYDTTHSLIVFLLIFSLVYILTPTFSPYFRRTETGGVRGGRVWWPILAWGLHIGLDSFSHANTVEHGIRIFWPISDWHVGLFMWSSLPFTIVNAVALATAGAILFIRSRKKLSTGRLTQN